MSVGAGIVGAIAGLIGGVLIGRATRKTREVCECPACGYTEEKVIGVPCTTKMCPECGATLRGIRCI